MRGVILYPPQWIAFSPHLAGPAIQSALQHQGHDIRLTDLNIAFYNQVLTTGFMHAAVKDAFEDYHRNAEAVFRLCPNGAVPAPNDIGSDQDAPEILKRRYLRYKAIFNMAQRSGSAPLLDHNFVIRNIEIAAATLRDPTRFFIPAEVQNALGIIRRACEILSAVYHPSKVYFLEPTVQIYDTVDTLKSHCENRDGNIFYRFYEGVLPAILKEKPDFIGVSLGDYSQLLPGLTLTLLLKKAAREADGGRRFHICIGGNLFGRYTDVLVNSPAFFDFFADSVIFHEGEKPVLALMQYLEGRMDIAAVPNLIYVDDRNQVRVNPEEPPFPVDTLGTPDFFHLTPAAYYLPEMIFNIQASRSCYWRNCSFCTHHFGSRYAIKSVDRTVQEIKELQQRHHARYFHFVDEAINPAYLRKLSQRIIAEGLKLQFYIYGRFEKVWDRELFRLAYQAGLRMILWGFESADERVYRLMNKGEPAEQSERLRILKDAYAEGIWNFLFVMFGFPTETLAEAKKTVDFLADNKDILSHGTGSSFMLLEGSPILKDLEKFSITNVEKIRNGFSFAHRFQTDNGMTVEEKKELDAYKKSRWRLDEFQYRDSSFREKLFLYVCRFGVEKVTEIRRAVWL